MGLYFPEYAINIIVLVKIFSVAINRFLQRISQDGGLASSNNFIVKFMNPPFGMPTGVDEAMEFYCNEAQLPNLNTAEGTINGLYLGSGSIKYAHTRVYTEVQLGFLCDANMTIKKDQPARRKSFRARHKCDQKKSKLTAGYWSCKKW